MCNRNEMLYECDLPTVWIRKTESTVMRIASMAAKVLDCHGGWR